jgi:hypothetical protein
VRFAIYREPSYITQDRMTVNDTWASSPHGR